MRRVRPDPTSEERTTIRSPPKAPHRRVRSCLRRADHTDVWVYAGEERERERGMKGDGKEIEVTLRSDEFDAD
jgi:hypothetical protein